MLTFLYLQFINTTNSVQIQNKNYSRTTGIRAYLRLLCISWDEITNFQNVHPCKSFIFYYIKRYTIKDSNMYSKVKISGNWCNKQTNVNKNIKFPGKRKKKAI